MNISFRDFAKRIAFDRGGFTLWIGAGASIAATRGKTPGWKALIDELSADYACGPMATANVDMPAKLEELSQRIGHKDLRKELRRRLIVEFESASLDLEVLISQAMIGARASALVSFNIEYLSALPFHYARDGVSFVGRTFRERSPFSGQLVIDTQPGIVFPPVYFPHGLLDLGNVVMTKSEYDKHLGSLAVTTAVHLAIGGDLVIIGMSLGDTYLRDALLQNRRWIREIYWLGSKNDFQEWSRVAEVTFVEAPIDKVWQSLGRAILLADHTGKLQEVDKKMRADVIGEMKTKVLERQDILEKLLQHARYLVGIPEATDTKITEFAEFCIAAGFDVPDIVLNDPRCCL
jgi:hypothetical protein